MRTNKSKEVDETALSGQLPLVCGFALNVRLGDCEQRLMLGLRVGMSKFALTDLGVKQMLWQY